MALEFMDTEIKRGDTVVLARDENRVSVTYDRYQWPNLLVDSYDHAWVLGAASGAWSVVGHVQNEPKVLPTRQGWYVASSDDSNDGYVNPEALYLDEIGQWSNAIGPMTEDAVREYDLVEPVYGSDEHFTAISSDGSKVYELVKEYEPKGGWELTCTCPGYTYRKECKHVKAYMAVIR